jgi:hypothetical protein
LRESPNANRRGGTGDFGRAEETSGSEKEGVCVESFRYSEFKACGREILGFEGKIAVLKANDARGNPVNAGAISNRFRTARFWFERKKCASNDLDESRKSEQTVGERRKT